MIKVKSLILLLGLAVVGVWFSCKTKDPPPELTPPVIPGETEKNPTARLFFERIEAEAVEQITLYFVLEVDNPRSAGADFAIQNWHIQINDQTLHEGAVLRLETKDNRIPKGASAQFPLRLDLDMNKLSTGSQGDFAEYQTALQVHINFVFDTGAVSTSSISTAAAFPRIREPELSIASIAVSKTEQVKTRFRLILQIDNPNEFPLELSSLSYTFYGNGVSWAEGKQDILLRIPANSSAETPVFLLSNVIDISRNWQDQLLALKQIQYRLTGETTILTNVIYLPQFRMDFDIFRDSD